MAIRGDLLSADLSNVFQMLALNRKSGQLLVQETGNLLNKRRLYVREDRVSLHEELPQRPIVALLVEMGVLSYEQYREVLSKSARYNSEPIRLLQQMNLLDDDQMDRVRHRVEEEGVLEVFLWRNITFELDEEAPAPPEGTPAYMIDSLIMESARRQDEWSQFVEIAGVNRQIYIRSGHLTSTEGLELEPIPHIVLDHVDGVRGSREIVEETGLPRYFVDLSLRGLHDAGYIVPLGLSELITTGDRLVEQGHHAAGLRLFRTALQFDRRNQTLHQRLARSYYDTGRLAKSAAHYRFCAMSMLASGQRRDALNLYENVLQLLPTDFKTLERCLDLLAQEGAASTAADHEVCENARKLLSFYLDTQQDHKALAIIENLQALGDEDEDLINTAARLNLRTGQTEKAVRAYTGQAQRRFELNDLPGALDLYRTLSGVDPSNRQIYQGKIAEIHRIQDQARRRQRRIRAALLAGAVFLLAGLGYAAYAVAASSDLARVPTGEPSDKEAAARRIDRLRAVAGDYPLTPAAFQADARVDEILGWIKGQEDARRDALLEEQASRDRATREADMQLDHGLTLLGEKKLPEALKQFRSAIQTVEKVGARWERVDEARTQIRSIQQYLEEGTALLREGEKAWKDGDLATARARLGEVVEKYKRLPELEGKKLELPVRIVAFPSTARITSRRPDGSEISAQGTLSFAVLEDAHVKVTVALEGFQTAERTISPAGEWDFAITLERTDGRTHAIAEPVAALRSLPDDSVVLAARNGKLTNASPTSLGDELRWERPRSLSTLRVAPAVNASGILTACESGRFRLADRRINSTLWEVVLEGIGEVREVLAPVPMGRDFAVCVRTSDGQYHVARLSMRDGSAQWSVTVDGTVVGLVAGARGVALRTDDGALHLLAPDSGAVSKKLDGPFTGMPAMGSDGRLLVHRADIGVQAMAWDGSAPTTVLAVTTPIVGAPVDATGTLLAASGDTLFIGRSDGVTSVPTGAVVEHIVAGPKRCAVSVADGRILVVDPAARSVDFAVRTPSTSPSAIAVTATHLVIATAERALTVFRLQ